jgi:hypothetical protein
MHAALVQGRVLVDPVQAHDCQVSLRFRPC